jgi:putative FmdB family regulatory protein
MPMPIYEYKCSKCNSVFEVIQKVAEPPLKKCIKCGEAVTKTISAPAIQFKGSGWYITDYAKKPRGEKEQKPASEEKKETKKSDTPSPKKAEKNSSPPTK